ncbi:MAG TPA: hypothetical protein VMF09_09545 [Solirubrobacteraceae bacterium]|nr:hypothetical protein [Solirubrobacteraceae bacterium]
MDHSSSTDSGRGAGLPGRSASQFAREVARERQKQELRHERDVLVLELAKDLGEQQLAQRFGVRPAVVGKLVADARERLDGGVYPAGASQINARRLGSDRHRWAEADAHYEALGSGPSLSDRRRTSSPASS